ncbi:MAG: cytochrome c maturation protein CcmE [Anaerolineaceae bacterium]|nr:cytochrome c maturation protein CcmE [Anaerolineaceae bacterium]
MKFPNKFLLGGILIAAAIAGIIITATAQSTQYFLTVEELNAKKQEMLNRDIRISGAVIGDTIQYDSKTLKLEFTIAHVSGDNDEIERLGGLGNVLHQAVNDPTRARLKVVYNGVKPDLMRNEAQAIMTGKLGEDGIFYAEELLLKCPSRYEESVPSQAEKP